MIDEERLNHALIQAEETLETFKWLIKHIEKCSKKSQENDEGGSNEKWRTEKG